MSQSVAPAPVSRASDPASQGKIQDQNSVGDPSTGAKSTSSKPRVELVQVITPADLLRFDIAGPQMLAAIFLILLFLSFNVFYSSIASLLLVGCTIYGALYFHRQGTISLEILGVPPANGSASRRGNYFLRSAGEDDSSNAAQPQSTQAVSNAASKSARKAE